MVGNPIRMTARAEVPRRPHFGAAVGVHLLLEGFAPEIPDHTLDMHTTKGKAMGLWLRSLPQRWREADPAADSLMIPKRTKPTGCGRSGSRAQAADGQFPMLQSNWTIGRRSKARHNCRGR